MSRTAQQVEGRLSEDEALAHLQSQGLKLVERNFQCKAGELDLIMRDGHGLVFVEVRKRATTRYGGALWSITPAKQKRIVKAAGFYLLRYHPDIPPCRIDVIAIQDGELRWLRNVFEM